MHQHTEQHREINPIEAAYAVARYLPADPALWIEQCALAGVALSVTRDGLLGEGYGEFTDRTQATFLASWLNLTPGGTAAVVQYLRQRQSAVA